MASTIRKRILEGLDRAEETLSKMNREYAKKKTIDLVKYRQVCETMAYLRAALRAEDLYQAEAEKTAGTWNNGSHYKYMEISFMLEELAALGETFFYITYPDGKVDPLKKLG